MEDIIFDEYDEYELQKKKEMKSGKKHRYSTGFRKCALAIALAVCVSTGFSAVPGRFDNMATVEAAKKKDNKKPVLKLQGAASLQVIQNESVRIPKTTAKDKVDGNLTKKIKVSVKCGKKSYADLAKKIQKNKAVKFIKIGKYVITYTVSDKAKNKATKKRTVTVVAKAEEGKTTEATTTQNPTTEQITTAATTEQVTTAATTRTEQATTTATTEKTTEECTTVFNTEGKNTNDVSVLQKIINLQNTAGATIPRDLENNIYYLWNQNGRLEKINWCKVGISGTVSFEGLSALKRLDCSDNKISGLNIDNNSELDILHCENNSIEKLNLSGNKKLTYLCCDSNKLAALDVQSNTELTDLHFSNNDLIQIDVTQNKGLTNLSCSNNKLTDINLNNNTELQFLYCDHNQLSNLDVSANVKLTNLYCYNNQLQQLNVDTNYCLVNLNCSTNYISTLDVSNNKGLLNLSCHDNQLTQLDLSNNTELLELRCKNNNISSLDITANKSLFVDCDETVEVKK